VRVHNPLELEAAELDRLMMELPEAVRVPAPVDVKAKDLPQIEFSSARQRDYAFRIIAEYAARCKEALHIYEPLPEAARFHRSRVKHRLVVGSNRGGKTLMTAVEVARIITGQDPYKKLPAKNGTFLAVGQDDDHVCQVMWRKMAFPGAFQMVPDLETGLWRAIRTNPENPLELDPSDVARRKLWRPAPPLIPPRLLPAERITWTLKKGNIPKQCNLLNGWELRWRSSNGAPDQGTSDDGAWFDEEMRNQLWYTETIARLVDKNGLFIWSATAQGATDQLLTVNQMCEDGHPDFAKFEALIDANPYLDAAGKKAFRDALLAAGQDEFEVRYCGRFLAHALRVYPEFQESLHCCEDVPIPPHWTRYMIVDPGFQVCAILFAAIPPDMATVHIYDECYIRECNANKFADEVQKRMFDILFEAFIIDDQGGGPRHASTGRSIADSYLDALKVRGIRSRRSGFVMGSSDTAGRTAEVKRWLAIDRESDKPFPKLQIHGVRCPNLIRELRKERFRKIGVDKRELSKGHATDCLEYLAAYRPQYRKPERIEQAAYFLRESGGRFEVIERRTDRPLETFTDAEQARSYCEEQNEGLRSSAAFMKDRQQWSKDKAAMAPFLASIYGQ
jgi:hypothetical protein